MNVLDQFRLDGQVAIVTGCTRGIGLSMAIALAEAGADIIGVSSSMSRTGTDLEQAVTNLGRSFTGYTCDFSKRDELYAFIYTVRTENPIIDILVNNAGTTERSPAVSHGDELWDRVIEVNQSAPFILTREIGKDMVSRNQGKIVFTASLLTYQGGITVPGYAASKGAIGQMTKAFANEWAAHGVNVNAIAPGYIKTDLTDALYHDSERSESISMRIPAGRWGRPDDFAGPIVFLCSRASDYMHGSVMLVDGGWMGR